MSSLGRLLLANARIGTRLAIAVALPLVAVLALGLVVVSDARREAARMGQLNALTGLSVTMGNLVHELQRERGASAVFINSNGAQMATELPQQRERTSARLRELQAALASFERDAYETAIRGAIDGATSALAALDQRRGEITARSITGAQSNGYFTTTIARLLDLPREAVRSSDDHAVTASLLAYYSYLSAKERAGQERAAGAVGFAAGRFEPAQHRALLAAMAEQQTFFTVFEGFASAEQRRIASETVRGDVVSEVE